MARSRYIRIDTREFDNMTRNILRNYPEFAKDFLKKIGGILLAKVKLLTPVDTGLLRRSWFLTNVKTDSRGSSIEIKNNIVYGAPVEYGNRGREGRFMLKRGMLELESQIPELLNTEIQNFIDENGG